MKNVVSVLFVLVISLSLFSQENVKRDKAVNKEARNGFYQDSILKSINEFEISPRVEQSKNYISVDFTGKNYPVDVKNYKQCWHNSPLSQGRTGTCWCFASTSLMESEAYRLTGVQVKLSEMYFVYWEYVERAKYYVKTRGDMYFAEGSEANAVIKNMKLYGAVPASAYSGKLKGQKHHDHEVLEKELSSYLKQVKEQNAWNEETIISTVKSILNYYMGEPPQKVKVSDAEYTPIEYLEKVLELTPLDYYSFMSTQSQTYNQKGELIEPDNWWHCKNYYNIHLDDFLSTLKSAVTNGYTISICGDVSEPGYDKYAKVGIIPTFDIPSDYINEDSREYRLNNQTTFDDHCIHVVGYQVVDGKYWFMIKDSGSGGFDAEPRGYRFLSEDYVKLKIIAYVVHKTAAKAVLDKIIK
jgi:bleomycin hydrolase